MSYKGGVIYILTNPAFPEYVKIGYADNLERRLSELNRSEALPFAFRVYAIYEVTERLTDKKLHDLIDVLNPDLRAIENFDGKERKREFYAMSKEDAYMLLECIAKISGTANRLKRMKPTGHEILDEQQASDIEEKSHRAAMRFIEDCHIPQGDQIEFIPDPSIKATVIDDRRIEYNGESMSLTALADKIYADKDSKRPNSAATLMFSYKGEKLTDLRLRMEANHE